MSIHTLMFGWEYPPRHSGGLGVACQGIVRGLLHHGVQVTLVLPSNDADPEPNLSVLSPNQTLWSSIKVPSDLQPYDSFQSYAHRTHPESFPDGFCEIYGPDLGHAVEKFTAMSVELTKHVHPDVVHCHDWMTFEAGIRAARHHRKPVVAHVHATELDRTDFHPNQWIADRERNGLLAVNKVITVSRYTKDILNRHYGIPLDKIEVVHNGHEEPQVDAPPALIAQNGRHKSPLVLFLGRLTVQKNPWQFLNVARMVRDHRADAQFVMAGDGGMLPGLIDRACELGLADCVVFTGKVNRAEVQALYKAADCFVMPSLSEPFGLVTLEAIAHRTPVIISKQAGVAEVVDHAFKIDYWDTEKMADCILTILREEALATQLKAEAPRVLQKLTWQNQAQKITSIYRQLLHT